ncbi:MAG: cellulase family glycosylhydrolase [Acidobacteria bacterium]|nr:cellulase family glycosylhydrolase [Acidobacteriota bacterium]
MPDFSCRLSETTTPLTHFWEHTVGSDHAPVALRADWQAQLRRCHEDLGFRYVRFHGLLSDDMGTLIDHDGKPLYSFFNADQVVDFLLSVGMRPFVELSFMPEALASGYKTVFHYKGNITPPKDYKQWATLMNRLARHWVERYGVEEVREWFFEVWNEPNLPAFWKGTQADYFKLYRHTVEAIKSVDPALKVGGPATAKNEWIEEFLEFCEKKKLPVDFVSTHHYPTDALGNEGDDTETQLATSRRAVLREQAQDTFRRARGKPVFYTEWNASSNPRDARHDEPYAAAFVAKTILEANGLVEGYSFWTFTDIFEENYFPSVPFHGGFGLLTLHGVPKPAYRAFELLHRLGTEQLLVDGIHETVSVWAVRQETSVTVLATNHALPRHSIKGETVDVRISEAREPRHVHVERIDEAHANPQRAWREMGAPEYLSALQLEHLHAVSRMAREPLPWKYDNGVVHVEIEVPPHAVAAITVVFA